MWHQSRFEFKFRKLPINISDTLKFCSVWSNEKIWKRHKPTEVKLSKRIAWLIFYVLKSTPSCTGCCSNSFGREIPTSSWLSPVSHGSLLASTPSVFVAIHMIQAVWGVRGSFSLPTFQPNAMLSRLFFRVAAVEIHEKAIGKLTVNLECHSVQCTMVPNQWLADLWFWSVYATGKRGL